MVEIKDLTGLSKPLTRLIEVAAKGLGKIFESYFERKKSESKGFEIRSIAAALDDVRKKHNLTVKYKTEDLEITHELEPATILLGEQSQLQRLAERLEYQGRVAQSNIEKITSVAAVELECVSDDSIPEDSPDDDWILRFFKYAQDVSSEQMQDLWGRILAGEIQRPGAYSLRALEFVRNMSKSEAELFEEAGKFALDSGEVHFVHQYPNEWLERNRGITYGKLSALAEIGLLSPTSSVLRTFLDPSIQRVTFPFRDRILIVNRAGISQEAKVPMWSFSGIGSELIKLIPKQQQQDEEYLEQLGRFYVSHGGHATLGEILKWTSRESCVVNDLRHIKE
jgi:hypothetical protein